MRTRGRIDVRECSGLNCSAVSSKPRRSCCLRQGRCRAACRRSRRRASDRAGGSRQRRSSRPGSSCCASDAVERMRRCEAPGGAGRARLRGAGTHAVPVAPCFGPLLISNLTRQLGFSGTRQRPLFVRSATAGRPKSATAPRAFIAHRTALNCA